jgi:hypothetical protein
MSVFLIVVGIVLSLGVLAAVWYAMASYLRERRARTPAWVWIVGVVVAAGTTWFMLTAMNQP